MACEFIGWCVLEPAEQAAWAQAVLSVIGIGIAIAVPWRQHKVAMDLKAKGSSVRAVARAAAVIKPMKELAKRIQATVDLYESRDPKQSDWALGFPAIPQSIMDQVAHVPELGEPGAQLLKTIHHCIEVRDVPVTDHRIHASSSLSFEQHLYAAKREADKALAGIQVLLD